MNINQDDVIYSLNKKGRWELPDIIRNSILWGSYKDLKSNVKLIVSHNISKKSHTVGYYASKGKTKKVESKRKTYFNGESVAAKASYDNKNASNGEQPVLQIEVVYPTPNTCSMVHNPKYVGHYIEKPDNGRGKTSKSKRIRQKLTVEKYCEELYDPHEDEFDESDEDEVDDESHVYIYSRSSNDASTSTELLNDIMIHAALMQSLCETRNHFRKTSSKQKFETKDNKIYEVPVTEDDVTDDEYSVSESISSHNETIVQKKMDPVYVVLPKEDLDQNLLKERYGNKYTECPCFPRKFIIDVSDRMKHRVLTSGCWKQEYAGKWDLTSCVVFCYDEYDINNTDTHNVYRISLNIATDTERFKILTMFDYFEGCIEEVLQRAVSFLDMLSTDGFVEKENGPPKGELMGAKFENLNRHQKVDTEMSFVSRKSLYVDIFNTNQSVSNKSTAYGLDFECISSEFCEICFDQITEGRKHGTALTACGHWFCDECWIVHCRSRMIMGANNISCPEYKCKETVDESVLLTFINVFEILNMKRRAKDNMFQCSEYTKWCPNPQCGRVIKVNNPEQAKDVACQCGTLICFQCQQKSHWPVTCQMAPLYWKKMKRLGHDHLLMDMSLLVRGKQCPKCKRFVEKRGGCFYMNCICGAQFCWGCLGMYPEHTTTVKCNQYKNGDLKGTDSIVVTAADAYGNISKENTSGDYKKAIDHRNARHPLKINKLKTRVREINFKFKNLAKRKGPRYFSMFTEADRINDTDELEVAEKIRDLLFSMVSVYIELHHVAEYSYIFLERLKRNGIKCSQFRSTVDCIGYYANEISYLLSEGVNVKDFRPLITTLMIIQQRSGDATKHVVKCMKRFDV